MATPKSAYHSEVFIAIRAAAAAGEIIAKAWCTPTAATEQTEKTSSTDLVTATDKACEELVVSILKSQHPDHRIIGEEGSGGGAAFELTDEPTWVIDPVDGTTNFVHRNACCSVLIGLVVNKQVVVGVALDPIRKELFYAVQGEGAYHLHIGTTSSLMHAKLFEQSNRLQVSGQRRLDQALIGVDMGYSREPDSVDTFLKQYRALTVQGKVQGVRTFGSCGLEMVYVAAGRIDACYQWFGPYIWDFAGCSLIVTEAGGFVGDPTGGEWDLAGRRVFAAASKELAEEMITLINAP